MSKTVNGKIWGLTLRSDNQRYSQSPITPPSGITRTVNSSVQITLQATGGASSLGSIAGYKYRRNGVLLNSVPTTSALVDSGLNAATVYTYSATFVDSAGNESGLSADFLATTASAADTTPPTTPVISVQAISQSSIRVSLVTPSTDASSGLRDYSLQFATTAAGPWSDLLTGVQAASFPFTHAGLAAGALLFYRVVAFDIAGNSANSVVASTSTPTGVVTADVYVASTGNNANAGTLAAPYATIAFALTKISAGQSVGVLTNLTETLNWSSLSPGGTGSANHKVVKAITPQLVITGAFGGTNANMNLTFMDLRWNIGTGENSAQFVEKVVFIRCSVTGGGGTNSGNVVQWVCGSNQAYHGCWGDGTGGRYSFLVYQCTNVLLNECLVRTQANVWGPPASNPTGGFTVYSNPSGITMINCIGIDCQNQGNNAEWLGAFNFVANVGQQAGVRVIQCIAMDNAGLIGIQCDGANPCSVQFTNDVSVRNEWGAVIGTHLGSGSLITFTGGEYSGNTQSAIADFGNANSSANGVNTIGNGSANFNGIAGTGNTTNALNMAARVSSWKRYGTSFGLLPGEPGYDVPTTDSLWPFPNEAMIREKLAATSARGFCAGSFTLTSYIQR